MCTGDASTCRERSGQRKHGSGAGRRCTAALEEAGAGAAQDCFWPPQVIELSLSEAGLVDLSFSGLSAFFFFTLSPATPLQTRLSLIHISAPAASSRLKHFNTLLSQTFNEVSNIQTCETSLVTQAKLQLWKKNNWALLWVKLIQIAVQQVWNVF